MIGQRNREIPTEKVLNMQRQGMQSSEIISSLKDQGYRHEQISNAMDQAKVKEELSNMKMPQNKQVGAPPDLPVGLMDAPSPSRSNKYDNSEPELNAPNPSGFAYEPIERASYDAVEEIAESIIKEKWDDLLKGIGDIRLWKERIDVDIEGVKQELIRTQEKFENLQKAMMGRIKEYSEGVTNISTEMKALERVLEKILSPLTKSVKDLEAVSEKLSKRRVARSSTIRRKTKRKTRRKSTRRKR